MAPEKDVRLARECEQLLAAQRGVVAVIHYLAETEREREAERVAALRVEDRSSGAGCNNSCSRRSVFFLPSSITLEFRVQGLGSGVWGSRLRVEGFTLSSTRRRVPFTIMPPSALVRSAQNV